VRAQRDSDVYPIDPRQWWLDGRVSAEHDPTDRSMKRAGRRQRLADLDVVQTRVRRTERAHARAGVPGRIRDVEPLPR
jgi:hypothetical protein